MRYFSLVTIFFCSGILNEHLLAQVPPAAPPRIQNSNQGDPPKASSAGFGQQQPIGQQPQASFVNVGTEPELILDTGGFLSEVSEITFSPDGNTIAVAGDKLVRLFNTRTGELLTTLRGDRSRSTYGSTNTVAYSPDGQYLLVGIFDYNPRGSIRVYRTSDYNSIESILPGHKAPCTFIRFSRDGRYLASTDSDGEILLWDWNSRQVLKRIAPRNPDKPIIDCIQFADNAPFIMTVEHDSPHVYRVPDGLEINPDQNMPPKILGWMFDVLTSKVAWPFNTLPENTPRVYDFKMERNLWAGTGQGSVGGGAKYWVGLWNTRLMNQNAPQNGPKLVYDKHLWKVNTIAISPRGDLIASGDKFGEVHLWDANTGQQKHVIKSQGNSIYEAAFDASSNNIAFGIEVDRSNWNFNRYGKISKVIDLRQRAIRNAEPSLVTVQEEPNFGNTNIAPKSPSTGEQSHQIQKLKNGQVVSSYRIPSGRHPSVFTLLKEPKLGVQEPVLFGDNQALLAMWDSSRDEMQRYYHGHQSMITSISPSSNGKIFVTSSTDRTMRIWSLLDHTRTGVFDFKYENSAVIEVKPGTSSAQQGCRVGDRIERIDGKSLQDMYELMMTGKFDYKPGQVVPVVMKRDQRTYAYNMTLAEGFDYVEPLLNIFIGDHDEWIIWTPKGYYDCSPGADRLIGWHVNQGPDKPAQFFRAEQFKKQLYRPDVINAIIETGNVEDAIRLATGNKPQLGTGIDLTNSTSMAANAPPRVVITEHENEEGDARISIEAQVTTSNDLPITEVTLLHNGSPAKVFKPAGLNEQKSFQVSHRCRLFAGRNVFTFIASNTSSASAAEDAKLVVDSTVEYERSKVYVLAIGVSNYKNAGMGFDNLKYAGDDAKAFAASVTSHANGKLYSEVETKVLVDEQATRNEVLKGMQWLVDNVQPGDVVMFFGACHGFTEKENFYLATHDVEKDNLRATGVSWREITGLLHEELPACKRVVFLDACHSAGVANEGARTPFHDLASAEMGTIFYASCTFQQQSFENDEWKHGAFTKSILDILKDQSSDFSPKSGDGFINTLELESGVSDKVKVITGDRQHPVVFTPTALNRFNLLELNP